MLSTSTAVIRSLLGPLAAAGVGTSSSLFTKSVHGLDVEGHVTKFVDGPSASPFARPGGDQVILVQGGTRKGCTLEEAIDEAREGALILLRPGIHKGPVILSQPGVTIGGDASCSECIIRAGKERVESAHEGARRRYYGTVICQAQNTKIYNLTIIWDGPAHVPSIVAGVEGPPQGTAAVVAASGFVSLVNCDIQNAQGSGVLVRRQADASIQANRIVACGASAVSLEAQVSAQVRYNDILKSGGPGILIVEGANPLVEGNRIIRGAGVGVQVVTRGLGVIKNNDIALNRRAGVDIRTGGDPVVERNRLVKNLGGILCAEQGRGKLLDNTISSSVTSGISIMSGSVVEATSNIIGGSQPAVGVMVLDEGTNATLREHEIQGVTNGIVVAEGAHAEFIHGRIYHVYEEAVIARGTHAHTQTHTHTHIEFSPEVYTHTHKHTRARARAHKHTHDFAEVRGLN